MKNDNIPSWIWKVVGHQNLILESLQSENAYKLLAFGE